MDLINLGSGPTLRRADGSAISSAEADRLRGTDWDNFVPAAAAPQEEYDPWAEERRRLMGISSGAIEDPSVTSMQRQQALASAQAYGAVPEMQSAAARSRLQSGARGAVELGAGQQLQAQRLQAQQAAQEGLAQQLAQAQSTEQRRLEEDRRKALAKEMLASRGRFDQRTADQAGAAGALGTLASAAGTIFGVG